MVWRFQPHKYKDHYACFECRKAFRVAPFREWLPPEVHFGAVVPVVKCPDCARPMTSMGRNFKAPRRADVRLWRTIQLFQEAGIHYVPEAWRFCGPPTSPDEVPAFIERCRQNASPGRRLASRFADVRSGKRHELERRDQRPT